MKLEEFHPFRSAAAKQQYLDYYDQRASDWPVPSETTMVDTRFGHTLVRISGASDASPLVLLPASVLNSLMWIPNVKALSRAYRTYALDNIYDSGRSIYTRSLSKPEELVQWLDELFSALGLGNHINLMGLSYGSWLAHQYALRFPHRVRKVVLLAHPTIVPMNKSFLFRLLLSFVSPRLFKNFVHWLFEDSAGKDEYSRTLVEQLYNDMRLAGTCFKPKAMVNPTRATSEELRNLQPPALFLVGENEKTFSARMAIERLNQVAPQIRTQMIARAGHDLNLAQSSLVEQTVLEFLE